MLFDSLKFVKDLCNHANVVGENIIFIVLECQRNFFGWKCYENRQQWFDNFEVKDLGQAFYIIEIQIIRNMALQKKKIVIIYNSHS